MIAARSLGKKKTAVGEIYRNCPGCPACLKEIEPHWRMV